MMTYGNIYFTRKKKLAAIRRLVGDRKRTRGSQFTGYFHRINGYTEYGGLKNHTRRTKTLGGVHRVAHCCRVERMPQDCLVR